MGYDNYEIVIDDATESVMKDFGNGTRQSIASVWDMSTLNTRDRAAAEVAIQQRVSEKTAEETTETTKDWRDDVWEGKGTERRQLPAVDTPTPGE